MQVSGVGKSLAKRIYTYFFKSFVTIPITGKTEFVSSGSGTASGVG